jgi:hypothetical protein
MLRMARALLGARAMQRPLFFFLLFAASCGATEPNESTLPSPPADAGATNDGVSGEPFTPGTRATVGTVLIAAMQPSKLSADVIFQDFTTPSGEVISRFRGERWKATDCKKHEAGACEMIACDIVATPPLDTAGLIAGLPGGTVTVTRSNGDELALKADANNRYVAHSAELAPVTEGERVTVTVTGSDRVPAFTETVELEGAQRLTTSTIDVASGDDAEIAWTGSKTGRVVLTAGLGDPAANRVGELTCRFDAAAIPGALLAVAPKKAFTFVLVRDSTTKTIGGMEVTFTGALGDPFAAGAGYEVEVRLR